MRPRVAGERGLEIHEKVVSEYVASGGRNLGFHNPIADVSLADEIISVRTIDVGAKSYLKVVPAGRVHPITSAITNKAWKMTELTTSGTRVLRVELYGPQPTVDQIKGINAAIREATTFQPPVEVRVSYRP